MSSVHSHWLEANQHYLQAHVQQVIALLANQLEDEETAVPPPPTWELESPSALAYLRQRFGLSPFEEALLLLCVGMELNGRLPALCARANNDPNRPYPTFDLALNYLPQPHWDAITPAANLRYWQLIELDGGPTLNHSPLRINERMLHYLIGTNELDERLTPLLQPLMTDQQLVASHAQLATKIIQAWESAPTLPLIQLCGLDQASKQAIATTACHQLGLNIYRLALTAVSPHATERTQMLRLWQREVILNNGVIFLEIDGNDVNHDQQTSALNQFVHECRLLIISSEARRSGWPRPMLVFDVAKPTSAEQRALWQHHLGPQDAALDSHIDQLVAQFNLPAPTIQAVAAAAIPNEDDPATAEQQSNALWESSRQQARPRLNDLAQRIEPAATWDDLILPAAQKAILHEICVHVQQRHQVYEQWGFATKGKRGLGISALFVGGSGTGKTMAAEVLAQELRLDLYRIDLSAVVSKYIGETEKNLRRVFDAAEMGGAILLFDEADALFGKRSEVKDSHDRYANIEVSYLLQRMEAYRGLAILTSNLKDALDTAFLRRIRFVVDFPFPSAAERAAIWQRVFPNATPTSNLDMNCLAQLNIPGGNIRNIALYATFLAAEANEPVQMSHLLHATRREYGKLEKSLTQNEIRGWIDAN